MRKKPVGIWQGVCVYIYIYRRKEIYDVTRTRKQPSESTNLQIQSKMGWAQISPIFINSTHLAIPSVTLLQFLGTNEKDISRKEEKSF